PGFDGDRQAATQRRGEAQREARVAAETARRRREGLRAPGRLSVERAASDQRVRAAGHAVYRDDDVLASAAGAAEHARDDDGAENTHQNIGCRVPSAVEGSFEREPRPTPRPTAAPATTTPSEVQNHHFCTSGARFVCSSTVGAGAA